MRDEGYMDMVRRFHQVASEISGMGFQIKQMKYEWKMLCKALGTTIPDEPADEETAVVARLRNLSVDRDLLESKQVALRELASKVADDLAVFFCRSG